VVCDTPSSYDACVYQNFSYHMVIKCFFLFLVSDLELDFIPPKTNRSLPSMMIDTHVKFESNQNLSYHLDKKFNVFFLFLVTVTLTSYPTKTIGVFLQ